MNSKIYTITLAGLLALSVSLSRAQEQVQLLEPFNKIVVSPKINLVLIHGTQESIELDIRRADPERVNVKVKGKTLRIYLDNARKYVKHDKYRVNGYKCKEKQYEGVRVTAYVTYNQLKKLEVRGEEWVQVVDPLVADKFKLKVYGVSDLHFSSIQTDRLKVKLYGVNELDVDAGRVKVQKYSLFGENRVDTRSMESNIAKTSVFGEGDFNLTVSRKLKVSAMGETFVTYRGPAYVHKGIVFGESKIRRVGQSY